MTNETQLDAPDPWSGSKAAADLAQTKSEALGPSRRPVLYLMTSKPQLLRHFKKTELKPCCCHILETLYHAK